MPNSSRSSMRESAIAPDEPEREPDRARARGPGAGSCASLRRGAAPIAMRTPISTVRWLTDSASTPPMPAAVITKRDEREDSEQHRGDPRRARPSRGAPPRACGCGRPAAPGRSRAPRGCSSAAAAPGSLRVRTSTAPQPGLCAKGRYSSCAGLAVEPVLADVADDADDRDPRLLFVAEAHALADRVLVAQVVARERLVHDGDGRVPFSSSRSSNARPRTRRWPIVSK